MLPAISALFGKAGVSGDAMDYFLVPIAIKGVPQMLAKKVGIAPEAVADTLIAEMGHSGAAHPLLMLSAGLEKARPGECILLASFGPGCALMLIEVTDAIGSHKQRLGVSGWRPPRIHPAN